MTSDASGSANPLGNRDKLAGLQAGQPASPPAVAQGELPWDGKPVSPAPQTPTAQEAHQQPVLDPSARATSAVGLDREGEVTGAGGGAGQQQQVAPAGVYPGQAGELHYWNGSAWDPRPVAGLWRRLWCWLGDTTLASVLAFALAVLLSAPASVILGGDSGIAVILALVGGLGGYLGYFAVSYPTWGRTPVMMWGRLDVVDIQTGARLDWGRAWLRSVVLAVASLSGILAIIWIAVANGATRQGPHDHAAKSVVLRRPA